MILGCWLSCWCCGNSREGSLREGAVAARRLRENAVAARTNTCMRGQVKQGEVAGCGSCHAAMELTVIVAGLVRWTVCLSFVAFVGCFTNLRIRERRVGTLRLRARSRGVAPVPRQGLTPPLDPRKGHCPLTLFSAPFGVVFTATPLETVLCMSLHRRQRFPAFRHRPRFRPRRPPPAPDQSANPRP